MRTSLFVAVTGVGLLLAAVPVWAHHAFAAEFDINRPLKLRGTVTKWEVTNPHSWIHIDVKGPDGKPVILRKTLQLNYLVRGDDVYPGEDEVNENPEVWVMR